ncbi:thiamine-phosphate kinase [Aliterella atlantica]|uniref:Thiamine-monophosphate kinase n=1 Tax=Aliterella atlantica CENA595 TaxID=1618023 RepID=A0A0D8ZP40_9CYAN|nr:thiamine-phosphate kinase [Aliterella atlantica]KJH70588.1 thiamine monophosphate kinase [Aliterella atlantica CENA595]
MTDLKIRDIGEKGLLQRLQRYCPADIIGDDAAVMPTQPGQALVVTTDVLVDGVHFSDRTTSPQDVGWRSAAANLSDLAAMGATPLAITVGLALPSDVAVDWVEKLYQGMNQCLQQYNTAIVGGDICRSSVTSIAITAFGQVPPQRVIRRNAARVGDAIVITGVHGASRAGLELLLHPELGQNLSNSDRSYLINAHQRPQPRLDVLPLLWKIAGASPRIAGMDSSDGLADAVLQICQMSGVGAHIEQQNIPIPNSLADLSPKKALDYVLYGGEDFELVLCMQPIQAQEFVQKLGNGAAIIGNITATSSVIMSDRTNQNPDEVLNLNRGFQHF